MSRRRKNAITDGEIAELRGTIMRETSRVIAHGGVTGCTLAAVAKAAGCSVGMIQHHFDTRDALVLASIQYRSDLAVEEWTRLARGEQNALARLRSLLAFAVEGDESFADAWGYWAQAYSAALRDDDIRAPIIGALTTWRDAFVQTVTQVCDALPVAPRLPAARIASFLVAAIDGYALQTLGAFYGGTPDSMRDELCQLAECLLGLVPGTLAATSLT